jgi:hypothetical protein
MANRDANKIKKFIIFINSLHKVLMGVDNIPPEYEAKQVNNLLVISKKSVQKKTVASPQQP